VVRALPVRPLPFPGGSFGSSLVLVAPGSDPGGTPLCRLPVSSKPFCPTTATARAMRVHLSWGSLPLQRSTKPGVRLSRWSPRPSGTVRPQGFSPSRRLIPPCLMLGSPFKSLARPAWTPRSAPGVSRPPIARHGPFDPQQGAPKAGLLSTVPFLPATNTCWRALPPCACLAAFHGRPFEGAVVLRVRPALRGLDRRKAGSHAVANHVHRPS